jgi:hypothetical protein
MTLLHCLQLQEVHDQIMREGIAKHHGYEIITEGDSFQVAFATCQAALAFCVDIQYRFLEQTWSKEVLRLNACKVVRGELAVPCQLCTRRLSF